MNVDEEQINDIFGDPTAKLELKVAAVLGWGIAGPKFIEAIQMYSICACPPDSDVVKMIHAPDIATVQIITSEIIKAYESRREMGHDSDGKQEN